MKFSPDGEFIAACTSHDNMLSIVRVIDGQRVSNLKPSMSSRGSSTILDFCFSAHNLVCILIKLEESKSAKAEN